MKSVLFGLFFCVALVGCRTDVTVEVYSSDLRVVDKDNKLTTPGTMAIEIPSANNCDEYTPQVVAIMKGIVEKFKPQGCKRERMDSFLLAEIDLPIVPSLETWAAQDALFGVVVSEDPKNRERAVLVTLNNDKYEILNKRMRDKFHQKADLSKSKVTVILHNDERKPLVFQAGAVFVDGMPILARQLFNLKRRSKARLELSNVHTAFLSKKGAAGAFLLNPPK